MKRWNMMTILLTMAALVLFSPHARATLINLDSTFAFQPGNSGDGSIQTWLTDEIARYNAANGTALSTSIVGAHPDIKLNLGDSAQGPYPSFGSNTLSITLPADLNSYLVLHWGGKGGGLYEAFDLLSSTETYDTFTVPSGYGGLSFYSFYGPPEQSAAIPEPRTLLLYGFGLAGLAVYTRKFRADLKPGILRIER